MRKLEMLGQSKLRIYEAEAPRPGPGEVLIETALSAICGSEMHSYYGHGSPGSNTGHEAVGRVIGIGAGVESLSMGQRVGVSAVVGCGDCHECAQGRYTWCGRTRAVTNMHAEQFVIAAHACHKLPDDLPWRAGVLLTGDGMGVPYHTYLKIRSSRIETIAVIGLGPVGLGNVLLQAYIGRRVIGVDLVDYRLQLARRLGADVVIKADGDLIPRIHELTAGEGVDVVIMCAGAAEAVADAFLAVRRGGTVVFNGELSQEVLSPSRDFNRREIWAVGCWYYFFHEFHDMLSLYRAGLDFTRIITHEFALSDAAEAFDHFSRGQTGKALLQP